MNSALFFCTKKTIKHISYLVHYVDITNSLCYTVVKLDKIYIQNMAVLGVGIKQCVVYSLYRDQRFVRLADTGDVYG